MVENVRCITLRSVKYSDTSSIATLWTRELGRLSVAIPSGSGREAQRRRAIMMPFNVFDAVATLRPGNEIARISDLRSVCASPSGNPAAGVVAMFLSDFLYAVLKDSPPDPLMSEFIFSSAQELGTLPPAAIANFHLYFLFHLGHFLGIEPDMGTFAQGAYFDMREGRFTPSLPLHTQTLDPRSANIAEILSRLRPRTLALLRLSRAERNDILDAILQYYSIHYAPVAALSSLPIVREIFA